MFRALSCWTRKLHIPKRWQDCWNMAPVKMPILFWLPSLLRIQMIPWTGQGPSRNWIFSSWHSVRLCMPLSRYEMKWIPLISEPDAGRWYRYNLNWTGCYHYRCRSPFWISASRRWGLRVRPSTRHCWHSPFVSASARKFGKRPVFLFSALMGLIGCIVGECATDYHTLLSARIIQGFSSSAFESIIIASIG